ncbi:unnamed protein product [Colias eurytheme]|nr:unnamed protein product [Colias eurytheme]
MSQLLTGVFLKYIIRMTSPAISKTPEKQKSESKSPSHASVATQQDLQASSRSNQQMQTDPLGCFRIFKLAGLMMKQGC